MTHEDKEHLKRVVRQSGDLIIKKYVKGKREHGGHLWKKPGLIDMAIEEAIDQLVYLLTLKEQLEHPEIVDAMAVDKKIDPKSDESMI